MPLTRALSNLIAQRPTLSLLARILRENGRAYLPRYALAFVFMFVFAGATALSAWMMRDVINKIFVDRDSAALAWIPGVILAIFVVKGPSNACSTTCCAWAWASTRSAPPTTSSCTSRRAPTPRATC